MNLWPKLDAGFDKTFALKPGSGSLSVGAIVDLEKVGVGVEVQHLFTKNSALYGQGSAYRTWGGELGAEAFLGWRHKWQGF